MVYDVEHKPVSVLQQAMRAGPVRIETEGATRVIRPFCNLTTHTSETVRRVLLNELRTDHVKYHIDLSHVHEVDSIGLSTLACFVRMVHHHRRNASMHIDGANAGVEQALLETDMRFFCGIQTRNTA